ncbi:MAG: cobalamin biosynthesis protein CobD [Actinobacteria bacterium]|nr:cobalamin biosynthesis protein CobD [Actinomycetota bacterium]MBV9255608.1 cobalamin biosynthesis protein CobD [Actinomycetota bacterium]MBV9663225.1 cobalamin biosynthesis protein CobD [Actinomycetota bacterium]
MTVLALLLDRLLGEPPTVMHPVVGFGALMGAVERRMYTDSRVTGALYTAFGVAIGASSALVAPRWLSTYVAVAGRALWAEASGVAAALEAGDIALSRERLPALVGRDPTDLDVEEIVRATVESVAENTVDAIVAPYLWGRVNLAGAYRAVNTMDAMVGHRSDRYRRFGWASARLDDAANYLPARVTAALVAAVRPAASGRVLHAVRVQAPAHPSPNAGVAEAAFAAALGLRLGGTNRYGNRTETRPVLGDGRVAEPRDIGRAVALSQHVTVALALAAP